MQRLSVIAVLFTLAFAAVALPAGATSGEPVGPSINVLLGYPTTFAADTPFNIQHGWGLASNEDAVGKFSFALEVDGAYRKEDFVERTVTPGDPDLFSRIWAFNFPDGMSGTHVFVGHWYAPCYATAGPCSNPNEVVEADRHTLTVTFS